MREPNFSELQSNLELQRDFSRQSPEVKRLFNPAFCSIILWKFLKDYGAYSSETPPRSISLLTSYLVLPIVLHRDIQRMIVSHNNSYGLHRFVRGHPETLIDLPDRVRGFVGITNQTIIFGSNHGSILLDSTGQITSTATYSSARLKRALEGDEMVAFRAAGRLASWFAQVSEPEIFIHLCIAV